MSHTEGTWTNDGLYTDGHIFIGAEELVSPTLTTAAVGQAGEGLLVVTAPVSATTDFYKTIDKILRTGVLASFALGQQAFGTAASVPGPSSVAGTSSPSGLQGRPPILAANLPTIKGPVTGAIPKGMQVNSVDVIYTVLGANATSVSFGLTTTQYGIPGAGATAPIVANLITFGANGLPIAVAANPVTTNIAVTTPALIITPDTKIQLHLRTVNPVSSTVAVAGVVLNVSYNYN